MAIDFIERADVDKNAPCPTLLLLDLNLPRHSGDEVLQRLRRSSRCGNIPVVVLTSSDAPQDRLRAAALGANSCFLKPSDLTEFMKLGQVVAKLIGSAS